MDLENSIYGYLHEGGKIVPKEDKQIQYKLDDDEDMHMMLSHSYDYARIYVLKRTRRVEVEEVDGCPWRITANSVGTTKILKVNIFIDVHNHCADVECSSQPSMRGRRGARIIEQVIRATPEYLPRQFAKTSGVAYDADDGMFPIAFGVVSSENYEDWLWFLQKLKGILQDKRNWKAAVGPKTEEKLLENIIKIDIFWTLQFNSKSQHAIVDADECVRDAQGHLYPSLKSPCSNDHLEGLDTVDRVSI
ncbi:hypothetical protein CK203_058840 [Vitis vinifera]|uniref:Transposase MuDR plant domain-containing protein n=1 Tax=Vitis vinifera TaxID=29760 RepID=A0A438G8P8_VITVI|nr:hypothetical protein CK203_058840 [Vitis vinifera]